MRSQILLVATLILQSSGSFATEPFPVELRTIDRSIAREPEYEFQPHYALVVFGPTAEYRSWLVMDGDNVLYFDRNGNGDLTEAEDRVELDAAATSRVNLAEGSAYKGMNVFPVGWVKDTNLIFRFWVRKRGSTPKDEWRRKIQEEREANDWETGTLWRIADDGSRAQNGICLTAKAEDSQITHLNGPLVFALKWGKRQRLQPWPKRTVFDIHIGTPSHAAKNSSHGVFSPLTETEIPRNKHPNAVFEFPPTSEGEPWIVREVELDRRCCGDTVYAEMTIPRESGNRNAKVTLTFPAWEERTVHTTAFEVAIEQEVSDRSEMSFVMFRDDQNEIDMSVIERALKATSLQIHRYTFDDNDVIVIRFEGNTGSTPGVSIALERGAEVQEVARALGKGSPHGTEMSTCNSRFTISLIQINEILAEATTINTIQSVLQDLTGGFIYNSWNGELFPPN